jgi:hypothetical protein
MLAEIDDLAAVVLTKLRAYHFTRAATDPQDIRKALQAYVDKAIEFVNDADHR